MTISDESRYRLYLRLEEVLGPEEATVLMEHLPPGGWAEVATKRDLEALGVSTTREMAALRVDMRGLEERVDLRFDAFSARMDARLERELRLMSWRVILAMLTLTSLAVAAPHL